MPPLYSMHGWANTPPWSFGMLNTDRHAIIVSQIHWSQARTISRNEKRDRKREKEQFSFAIREAGWIQSESMDVIRQMQQHDSSELSVPVSHKCSILATLRTKSEQDIASLVT